MWIMLPFVNSYPRRAVSGSQPADLLLQHGAKPWGFSFPIGQFACQGRWYLISLSLSDNLADPPPFLGYLDGLSTYMPIVYMYVQYHRKKKVSTAGPLHVFAPTAWRTDSDGQNPLLIHIHLLHPEPEPLILHLYFHQELLSLAATELLTNQYEYIT